MKISVYTHMTNPEKRMDPWQEALSCYEDIADELVTVGEDWPEEFKWDHIGKTFNEGFKECTGDWVLNLALDMFIHENQITKMKEYFVKYSDAPALAFPKYKFFNPGKYEIKSFDVWAINKKKYPNINFDGGGDLCLPTLNDVILDQYNVPIVPIVLWNYDSTFRTKEVIAKDRGRFARAWFREFNSWDDRGGSSDEEAYNAWFKMVKSRLRKQVNKKTINQHPKYIIDKLADLEKDKFGYDCFGEIKNVSHSLSDYIDNYKIRIKYKI